MFPLTGHRNRCGFSKIFAKASQKKGKVFSAQLWFSSSSSLLVPMKLLSLQHPCIDHHCLQTCSSFLLLWQPSLSSVSRWLFQTWNLWNAASLWLYTFFNSHWRSSSSQFSLGSQEDLEEALSPTTFHTEHEGKRPTTSTKVKRAARDKGITDVGQSQDADEEASCSR